MKAEEGTRNEIATRSRENERVVDETSFDSGTIYEIECESYDPQRPKGLLEEFFA